MESDSTLSPEERDSLLKVMERAKEFDQANKEGRLQQQTPTEGLLYKWTNPLKGWQPRWFYVNHEQGVLHYCMSEEKRKLPPRASLHLWGAVVSPSDEDSQSFTIQGINNDCYRLKAANAKDRQSWVSKMRMEVSHANALMSNTSKDLTSSTTSSMSVSSAQLSTSQSAEPTPQKSFKKHNRKSQLSAPSLNLSLTKLAGKKKYKKSVTESNDGAGLPGNGGGGGTVGFPGDDVTEALSQLQSLQESLIEQLETSVTVAGASPDNRNVLLLKATSVSAVQSIQDSLALITSSSTSSPVHHSNGTLSPSNPSLSSPSRRLPLSRQKRPMSMIDTSRHHYAQQQQQESKVEGELDNVVLKSTSVGDVGLVRNKETVPKGLSKEAP